MTSSPPRAEPLTFGGSERPCFGWLHRARSNDRQSCIGLVLCNPFGHEALSSHRSLRHFALAAASSGVPALRFDYDGTGDSAGDDRDPARWEAWVASVHQAANALRNSTGVQQLCFLGIRLGATLAALAASERDDVAGLTAIAPVVAGKGWLRELRALHHLLGLAHAPPGLELEDSAQEGAGFILSPETVAAISGVDLAMMQRSPAPHVLLFDREDFPPSLRWVERLTSLGSIVEYRRSPEYAGMMLDPHDAVIPEGMIRSVSAWLAERVTAVALANPSSTSAATPFTPPTRPSDPLPVLVTPGIEETADFLDKSQTLFGIISAPAGIARPSRAIILLNAGAIHRVGPNRLHVKFGRFWAARGFLVLRFDLAGLGDSPPWTDDAENIVYSASAVNDVERAMTYLREQWGVTECSIVGLCSGAYHALKSATAGLPLRKVVMINPLVFFWRPGMSLAYPAHEVAEAAGRYRRSILEVAKWKKFLSGKVDVTAFAQVIARRVAILAKSRLRDFRRSLGKPMVDDLGSDLVAIARRDIALRFVFVAGDPGQDLLQLGAGSALRRLLHQRRVAIERIEGPDHTFTPAWSHPLFLAAVGHALDD